MSSLLQFGTSVPRAVGLILAIFLAACAAEVPQRDLTIDLPDRYNIRADINAPAAQDVQWWRAFDDRVLDHLIRQGLANNIDLAEARTRVDEAEAVARREGVTFTDTGTVEVRKGSDDANRTDASLSATINLAGRGRHQRSAALARLDAARQEEADARRLLLSELTAAYVELRYSQARRLTRGQDLVSRRRSLSDVRAQLTAGAATQLDLLRAQSLVAETQAELPKLDADVIRQRNRISTLLGVTVSEMNLDLGKFEAQPIPKTPAGPLGVPADLLRARPDIVRAERLYAAAVSDLNAAQAARYPSLSLRGVLTAPLEGGSVSDSLAAGLTMPILSAPRLAADAEAAQARVQRSYLQWRRAVLEAVEDVETALAAYAASRTAVGAAREVVKFDTAALALSRRLLDSRGNITVLDLLDRERSLSASRAVLAQNLRDLAIDYVTLRVALGQGHDITAADLRAEAAAPSPPASID